MYSPLLLSTFAVAAFASPLAQQSPTFTGKNTSWVPVSGTQTTCDITTDKILGLDVGPQLEDILNNACAAMMPKCAYPDRAGSDTFCIQTVDWPLTEPKSSSQAASVMVGDQLQEYKVQFDVTPPAHPADSAGAQWTVQECYGYFAWLLEQWEPQGCRRSEGYGIGSIKVGGTPSSIGGEGALAETVFKVSIVEA
ncbi:hypothetical protein ACN47E_007331 [Coniothyrium glycines]